MHFQMHSLTSAALLVTLLLGVSQVSGQTTPDPESGLVRIDTAGGEPERSDTGSDSGAARCAYVPLFSKEAGMPGVAEDDPDRDNYGYIRVGDECH